MAVADTLLIAQQQIADLIVAITLNPKPSYTVQGQSVLWGDYLNQLLTQQRAIRMEIAASQGPFELQSGAF